MSFQGDRFQLSVTFYWWELATKRWFSAKCWAPTFGGDQTGAEWMTKEGRLEEVLLYCVEYCTIELLISFPWEETRKRKELIFVEHPLCACHCAWCFIFIGSCSLTITRRSIIIIFILLMRTLNLRGSNFPKATRKVNDRAGFVIHPGVVLKVCQAVYSLTRSLSITWNLVRNANSQTLSSWGGAQPSVF